MRTTQRIAKKHAAELASACFDIPYVLRHAKPSLFKLSFGTMRTYVYHTVRRRCGTNARVAKCVTWRWAAAYRALMANPASILENAPGPQTESQK